MNELNTKIRDLFENAGGYYTDFEDVGNFHYVLPDVAKFAELLLKDAFAIIKEAVLEGDESHMDDLLDVRLGDGAADVVDAYGIVERIYD